MNETSHTQKTECDCSEDISEEQLLKNLDEIIDDYVGKQGALIPVLQIAQNMLGYLPEPALKMISKKLDIPYSQVAGVVGFYSYFSTNPKGKFTIRVCLGTACYVRGGKDVLNAIENELNIKVGETTDDRKFSLEVGRCFGACGLAPVIMVNDETVQRVKPAKIAGILRSYE